MMIKSQKVRKFFASSLTTPTIRTAPPRLPGWMPRLAFAPPQEAPHGDVLVVIFLRGAADALNIVIPFGEEAYYALRPTLGIPRPDDRRAVSGQAAIDLDGFFGLHPALEPILPAWKSGHLAVVHACGAPDESRSHFKAMELMERGVEDARGPASGWIGRHLASLGTRNHSPLRAVGFGALPQRSLQGSVPITALRSILDAHLGGNPDLLDQMQVLLGTLYHGPGALAQTGSETLDMLATLQTLTPGDYKPAGGASYPETEFGMALMQTALLIKAQVGLEVSAIDLGGWDTHFAQGGSKGLMAGLLAELGRGLGAFYADLHDHMGQITVVTMSEFGRRARENGSLGTDHGHGSLMFLLGGHVNGGKVHGRWPGLHGDQLIGPGDLAVTTDYRSILGEICQIRLLNPAIEEIFPGYRAKFPGILRSP